MTQKKCNGFIFRNYKGDHSPKHVHIYVDKLLKGRFDLEKKTPIGNLKLSKKLKKALRKTGYLTYGDNQN